MNPEHIEKHKEYLKLPLEEKKKLLSIMLSKIVLIMAESGIDKEQAIHCLESLIDGIKNEKQVLDLSVIHNPIEGVSL